MIKGGKLLTAEQSVRLTIIETVEREKLLKAIVERMQAEARDAARRGRKK